MKLAGFIGNRSGFLNQLGTLLIRFRLKGRVSHTEILFEPFDKVDHLMPDGTCQPDAEGRLWMVSSTALEKIPPWSKRRPNKTGGVRFKRVKVEPSEWILLNTDGSPFLAAEWAVDNEGTMYDWSNIFSFIFWIIPDKRSRTTCHEASATMLGIEEGWRLNPCSLIEVFKVLKCK